MSITGLETREPVRTGLPMIDVSTGLTAAQAVLAALFHRRRTGKGQFIEVPLYDTGFSVTSVFSTAYMIDGRVPERKGNGDHFVHPVGQYRAADGDLMLSVPDDRRFEALCRRVIERPELLDDPRFASNEARLAYRQTLDATIAEALSAAPVMHWVERARAAGVAMGPVRSIEQAMSAPVVDSRGLIRHAAHPDLGEAPNIASPIRLDRTPVREPTAAPLLGRHTEEVLGEWLGRSTEQIEALRVARAIPAKEG
jgi:crotonobetainyl-CoA:carnitine CoA-transferase CaiB-like acyl-CoA transferase